MHLFHRWRTVEECEGHCVQVCAKCPKRRVKVVLPAMPPLDRLDGPWLAPSELMQLDKPQTRGE